MQVIFCITHAIYCNSKHKTMIQKMSGWHFSPKKHRKQEKSCKIDKAHQLCIIFVSSLYHGLYHLKPPLFIDFLLTFCLV